MGFDLIFGIHVKIVDNILFLKLFYLFTMIILIKKTDYAEDYPVGFNLIFIIYVNIVDNILLFKLFSWPTQIIIMK